MPFGTVMRPSIGLTLVKGALSRRGISSTIRYFSIRFAELLGWTAYAEIADGTGASLTDLPGEWIFNRALFDVTSADERSYVDTILRGGAAGARTGIRRQALDRILRARSRVDRFLDWCFDEVMRDRPPVVGFTSTFQQHVASLALARRIKERHPEVAILFGGANCEGPMGAETVRRFPFVDAAVSGEGDLVVAEVVERLLRGLPLPRMDGVRTHEEVHGQPAPQTWTSAPIVEDLDSLPFLDYSDYFSEFRASRLSRTWEPALLFESSRGCWWGQSMQCTFCGLNGSRIRFRSKSPRRALEELGRLSRAYPRSMIQTVDTVLDMKYFERLLPQLAQRRVKMPIFYETRSSLRKDQVGQLREAGIAGIQPGIESLSDEPLRLMRKGVTALQNIQLLKWCKELGVAPYWNLLWGFPGEPAEEYARMAAVVPLLAHLPPPVAAAPIRMDRFSPHFDHAEAFGFTDVRPLEAYRFVYPLPESAIEQLAAVFSYGYRDGRSPDAYTRRLSRRLRWWQSVREAELFSVDLGDPLLIFDLRPGAKRFLSVLSGLDRSIYLAADSIADIRKLTTAFGGPAAAVERAVVHMTSRGLMLRQGQRVLALAIPVGDYQPGPAARARFRRAIRKLGKPVSGGTRIEFRQPFTVPERRVLPKRRPGTIGPSLFAIPNERTLVVRNLPHRKTTRR